MAWIGVAGAAIAGAVGGSVAAASLTAYMIGGIVVGAVVGAVYQGVTDGSILKGMLYGAIGGAAVGGAGYALYGGAAAAGAAGSAGGAGGTAGSIGVGVGSASIGTTTGLAGGTTVSTAGMASGSQLAIGVGGTAGASTASGGFLSSLSTTSTIGSMASLGKEFLAGGMSGQDEVDKDWEREKMDRQSAENAKELENRLKIAGLQRGGAGNSAALQYKAASEQLAFEKQKFREEFDEQKRQFDVNRGDEMEAKDRFQRSVEQGGAYAAGQAQTVSLVEINRQRKELPSPPWLSGKSVNKTTPATPQPAV